MYSILPVSRMRRSHPCTEWERDALYPGWERTLTTVHDVQGEKENPTSSRCPEWERSPITCPPPMSRMRKGALPSWERDPSSKIRRSLTHPGCGRVSPIKDKKMSLLYKGRISSVQDEKEPLLYKGREFPMCRRRKEQLLSGMRGNLPVQKWTSYLSSS